MFPYSVGYAACVVILKRTAQYKSHFIYCMASDENAHIVVELKSRKMSVSPKANIAPAATG